MTPTDKINREEMKRFLFHELNEREREAFEERFFVDGDLFYELTDLENDLIDSYALGKMSAVESARFEKGAQKLSARRTQIANAVALSKFITTQKSIVAQPTLWEKIAGFFHFQKNLFQYATAALMILLMVGVGVLLYERARVADESVRLQNERNGELERQENVLQEQIRQAQEREQNLQKELEDKNGQAEILTEQIEREKTEKSKLERELEILRKEKIKTPIEKPKEPQPQSPIIATLLPYSGGKGGGGDTKLIRIKPNTAKIKLSLKIPAESTAETFDAKLNGENIASGLKPFRSKLGNRFLAVTLPTKKLSETEHAVTLDGNGETVRYFFRLLRQ